MADEGKQPEQRLKVFISYSRADLAFADELVAGLEYDGRFEVSIDRHSVVEGEDWKKRLGALIADADTVAFVLSPNSARSDICVWEVEEALRLSKRIIPVLAEPLGSQVAPEQLAQLNYVRFDEGRSFMTGLKGLVRALNTDLGWLREHTRLFARALEWRAGGRATNRLLSGADVAAAKAWAASRPKDAPVPTELHLDFIKASEEADAARASLERKRLRRVWWAQGAVAALVLAAMSGVIWQARETEKREAIVLMSLARKAIDEQQHYERAMRIALYGLPPPLRWPWALDWSTPAMRALEAELAKAAHLGRLVVQFNGHNGPVNSGEFSRDGIQVLTASDDRTARLWDAKTGVERLQLKGHGDQVKGAVFSPDSVRILTASNDRTARVWDAKTGLEVLQLKGHQGAVNSAVFSPDGARILTASNDQTARIWDAKTGLEVLQLKGHEGAINSAAFSPDGARVLTASADHTARVWDAETGAPIQTLRYGGNVSGDEGGLFRSGAFSPDLAQIVTFSGRGVIQLWDAKTGSMLVSSGYAGGTIASVPALYLKNTGMVILGTPDGTVDVSTVVPARATAMGGASSGGITVGLDERGAQFLILRGHVGQVAGAAMSPDGAFLVTASLDGTARVWGLDLHGEFGAPGEEEVKRLGGERLVHFVCTRRLVGSQLFTNADALDPILSGLAGTNPCERAGPLSFEYWRRLAARWWLPAAAPASP
jgi:WD40 repeat protein